MIFLVAQPMGGITASPQAGAHSHRQLIVLTAVWRLSKRTVRHSRLLTGGCNTTVCKYPKLLCHKGKPDIKIFYYRRRLEIMETCTTEQFSSFNKWVSLSVERGSWLFITGKRQLWKLPGICFKIITWKWCLGTMIIVHLWTQCVILLMLENGL